MIVGDAGMLSGLFRAFRYSSDSGVADFDSMHPNYNSWANAINDPNQAVGWITPGPGPPAPIVCLNGMFLSHTSNSHYLPVAFTTGGGKFSVPLSALGSLGGIDGQAVSINVYRQIVGWSLTRTGAQHAFLYYNGVMTDLNSLNASGAAGWTMYEADASNDEGQILGRASNAPGQTEIFILTP